MSSVQQFCLRWNNHQPNFISVCSSLLQNGTLVDVTLAAEGRQLQAHRIVLSACSSYFQSLFASNPCQHPIVILKDVDFNDLKTMVDFMYNGEVNVSQEQLPHILKTAEMLKIKGLAEMPEAATTSLTKSESKSSSEQPEGMQGAGSGSDSMWGSTESQFAHHHYHHQQTQSHHPQRRTPSPTVSPATRRKRLRKSSNSVLMGTGSAERTSEEQSSIEGPSNINLSQMSQISFGANASNLAQTIHTKIIKESSSTDTETHPQDSSQESMEDSSHQHHVQQIKPEVDISGVQQSIPLDISGPATPSEHETPNVSCSQSQSSHSGVQWTVVDSNYPRFSLQSCQGNISIGDSNQASDSGNSATSGQQHEQQNTNSSTGNSVVTSNQQQQGHIQMHYQGSSYTPQIIAVNNLVSSYQNISTPTSPNESNMVQSVYSQGPTPSQSPVHQISSATTNSTTTPNVSTTQSQQTQVVAPPQKRKRSVNPQGDENFLRALEAVRSGGIGFCKAARLYGVNNRTLWLEYKKRGYPISRPSIKSRIKIEPNISPPLSTTSKIDETTLENYGHINQPTINMQVPPTSETPTPIMCTPHAHPMGVMSFLDTRHMEFTTGMHTMSRQRYTDGAVNVNPAAMNLQGLNFNSM